MSLTFIPSLSLSPCRPLLPCPNSIHTCTPTSLKLSTFTLRRPRASSVSAPSPAWLPRMTATPDRASKVLAGPFEGQYGSWHLTQADADSVLTYRLALSTMCAAFSAALLASQTAHPPPAALLDLLYILNLSAFGVALHCIHIYLKPLHNMLKALWVLSVAGSLATAVALPAVREVGLMAAVYAHPTWLLAVGWQFVALTGVFVKEAFCFGRAEALALIALVPALAGGHFLGGGGGWEVWGGALVVAVFAVFCARKFAQPATDDLGDLSVFEHLAKGGSL